MISNESTNSKKEVIYKINLNVKKYTVKMDF